MKVSPSPAMPEVTELITVSGFDIFLIASEDVSDGDATGIVKTLHDNWESLQRDFPALRSGRVEDFATPTNTVPYHPAAIAYFKSKNLWSEGNKKREESFKR